MGSPKEHKPKLTRKQKAFADELLNDKKLSLTEAANRTYNVASRRTAELIGSENIRKPEIQAYLQSYDYDSQATIVEAMSQRKDMRLALDAAKDIQDRVHGRATQRVETSNRSISINIDLTNTDKGTTEP